MTAIATYILIIISGSYSKTQVSTQEFYTKESCEKAASTIISRTDREALIPSVFCVQK